jgi:hypothetical protein
LIEAARDPAVPIARVAKFNAVRREQTRMRLIDRAIGAWMAASSDEGGMQ